MHHSKAYKNCYLTLMLQAEKDGYYPNILEEI